VDFCYASSSEVVSAQGLRVQTSLAAEAEAGMRYSSCRSHPEYCYARVQVEASLEAPSVLAPVLAVFAARAQPSNQGMVSEVLVVCSPSKVVTVLTKALAQVPTKKQKELKERQKVQKERKLP